MTYFVILLSSLLAAESVRWEAKQYPLAPGLQEYRITVPERAASKFIVGVRVGSRAKNRLDVAEIGLLTATLGEVSLVRKTGTIKAPPVAASRVDPQGVEIVEYPELDSSQALAFFVDVESPITIIVRAGARTVYSGLVSDGIVIRNGVVKNLVPKNMQQLMVIEGQDR